MTVKIDNKYRFKRHESFYLREGWMEKAIDALRDGKVSFGKSDGVKTFGIGSNMVKSFRYWLIATNVMNESTGELSSFGNMILKYDPYLDHLFTWWIMHINLVTNIKDAPVFNILFNAEKLRNFKTEDLIDIVILYMKENSIDMTNSKMVKDDVSVFIRSYIGQHTDNPEENSVCPFSRLNLMKYDKKGYNFIPTSYKKLHPFVVYYSIVRVLEKEEIDSINIDDLSNSWNSPIKILNLNKNLLYVYLNDLSRLNLITVNRTAGLNMIYLQKNMSVSEVTELYFERERK